MEGACEGSSQTKTQNLRVIERQATVDETLDHLDNEKMNVGQRGWAIEGAGHVQERKGESEEEDDEDIDFNPFLQLSPSPEASSGLSSECEDLDEENSVIAGQGLQSCDGKGFQDAMRESSLDHGSEEDFEEMDNAEEEECEIDDEFDLRDISHEGFCIDSAINERDTSSSKLGSLQNEDAERDCYNLSHLRTESISFGKENVSMEKQSEEEEEEEAMDAICRRTRAHYSLADMSLDKLETFLQESDEEDYFQNVDDEEEYRKFVAAVQGKWQDEAPVEDIGEKGEDDDDEEDDYDFELEIEEALESEYEERPKVEACKTRKPRAKPDSRGKRRSKTKTQLKERPLGSAKTQLRLILPAGAGGNSTIDGSKNNTDEAFFNGKPTSSGFTTSQIGQLYCLIHEHVQLLVQVFALSIMDPSQQQIATNTHRLLMQLVEIRDQVLLGRKSPFPDICFSRSYAKSSTSTSRANFSPCLEQLHCKVQKNIADWNVSRCTSVSGLLSNQPRPHGENGACQIDGSSVAAKGEHSNSLSKSKSSPSVNSIGHENDSPSHGGNASASTTISNLEECASHTTFNLGSSSDNHLLANGVPFVDDHGVIMYNFLGDAANTLQDWALSISGPVYSVLDVPPLALLKEFFAELSSAVEKTKQQQLHIGFNHAVNDKVPIFPVAMFPTAHGYTNDCQVCCSQDSSQSKKTMAAILVENSKKESLALVPKQVSTAIIRFAKMFNPALFPHKPPPAPLARRLLFTDAEDELLAMGLMTYNTNWEAIQHHFLPSKTARQIFIRQKNRSAARAPENSIKAVRKLKTSPLTREELSCIQEALKVFKHDWMKVWKQCVPYRDPATLSRLWRAAIGIQQTGKPAGAEAKGNQMPAAAQKGQQKDTTRAATHDGGGDDGEVNSAGEADTANGAYLHEAFLRKPHLNTSTNSSIFAPKCISNLPPFATKHLPSSNQENLVPQANGKKLVVIDRSISAGESSFYPLQSSTSRFSADFTQQSSKRRRCKSRTYDLFVRGTCTIKLAPGLPSLNLPPSVRVIPQSKLTSDHPLNFPPSVHVISQSKSPTNHPLPTNNLLHTGGLHHERGVTVSSSHNIAIPDWLDGNAEDLGHAYAPRNGQHSAQNKMTCCTLPSKQSNSFEKHVDALVGAPCNTKLHPLLMQGTYEPGSLSCLQISNRSERCVSRGIAQQEIRQDTDVPGVMVTKQPALSPMPACVDACMDAELHPFLRERPEHSHGKRTSLSSLSIREDPGNVQWSSALFDPIVQPVCRQQKRGKFLKLANQSSSMPSTVIKNSKNPRRSRPCDNHAKGKKKGKAGAGITENTSNLNIVMEQEELSDSEAEEDVQFECEEMGDSEREESENEPLASDPDKKDENIQFEEEEIDSDDNNSRENF